ncbi:MAG: 30S ribosomal protein S2 [Kiritimatiellae bacterium]|nr:30S ribosomal protein S2 [Kiritimatiellia bacterium]
MEDLLEAGLHFGHQTKRWNPKMKRYIFGECNGIYIIDLNKSLACLKEAQQFLYDTVVRGRRVLFVGTKKQAQDSLRQTAEHLHQFHVTTRWLGGMLTNNQTVRRSVGRMRALEAMEKAGEMKTRPKKEVARLRRELSKLQRNLSGVADMENLPGALFVIDVNREAIAVAEASRLNIPVVALVDTNSDPSTTDYPIPGNDDAIRAIRLISKIIGDTIQRASNEYAQLAAEEARKRAADEAKEKAAIEKRKAKLKEAKEKAGLAVSKPIPQPSEEKEKTESSVTPKGVSESEKVKESTQENVPEIPAESSIK